MKKRLSALVLLLAFSVFSLTGCGIVKVVKIGEEASLTGQTTFNADAESQDTWGAIVTEITANAKDLSQLDDSASTGTFAVSGTGKITAVNQESKKGTVTVAVDGYAGTKTINLQIGPVYSGTSLRDAQTTKAYSDFTNQGEWSSYALSLNATADEKVVKPLAIDAGAVGKTVTFTGAYTASAGGTILITPIALTIQ